MHTHTHTLVNITYIYTYVWNCYTEGSVLFSSSSPSFPSIPLTQDVQAFVFVSQKLKALKVLHHTNVAITDVWRQNCGEGQVSLPSNQLSE